MKNIILLSLSLLTLNLSAQTFGLKGGMALTSFAGSDVEVIDKNTGLYLGAFLKMGENNIQWSPEIIFHQKGATANIDSSEVSLYLNYIEMGINAHFHINDELALTAGPYAGYAATTINKSADDLKKYNKVGFGVNLGASYAINDLFNIDLRYGIGLADIKDDGSSMQNTSLQVGFGYVFSY